MQVACGEFHTLALTEDGQVYVWGGSWRNKRGDKLEDRKGFQNFKPFLLHALEGRVITKIGCGDFHSVALEDNGNLYTWGKGDEGECGHGKYEDSEVPQRMKFFNTKNVIDVVAGNHHTLALTDLNELYSWGQSTFG